MPPKSNPDYVEGLRAASDVMRRAAVNAAVNWVRAPLVMAATNETKLHAWESGHPEETGADTSLEAAGRLRRLNAADRARAEAMLDRMRDSLDQALTNIARRLVEPWAPLPAVPDGLRLTYVVEREEYGADALREIGLLELPAIRIGLTSASGGGCRWEFVVEQVLDPSLPALRLRVFNDAFDIFGDIPHLFAWLREAKPCRLGELRAWLDANGFHDATRRTPHV